MKGFLRYGAGVAAALAVSLPGAVGQQTFQEWLQQDQEAFAQYKAEVTRQYEDFLAKEQAAFQKFVEEAGAKWGGNNVWVPQQKTWVQYTPDLEDRSAVNFEEGVVEVQVLIETDREVSVDDLRAALAEGIERVVQSGTVGPIEMMRRKLFGGDSGVHEAPPQRRELKDIEAFTSYRIQRGDTLWGLARRYDIVRADLARLNRMEPDAMLTAGRKMLVPYLSETKSTIQASERPLLQGQVRTPDGKPVTRENAREFAQQAAAGATPRVEEIKRKDGSTARTASVQFRLVPEHIRVRAERYAALVSRYARTYDIDPALVYAVMHTESAFNPRARSPVPAYGLMQLVPRSGARDAYRFVHKEDRLVTGTYLYDPERNIELGTAFLHILDARYLRRIEHPTSRTWCVVAAYNTGAGNVSRAFGAGTSVGRAAPIINRLDPEAVYARLRADLPYEETRNYVRKVRDRMALYR